MRMNERRTKMSSVKRKWTNKTSVQKCEIIRHIEKGMPNKEASERFRVLQNTISTWISNTGEEMQCVIFKFENLFTKERINSLKQRDITEFFLESTSSLYLLLCNAFNSYKKLIVHHITTYLFFLFSFPEIYELLSISNSLYLEQLPWSLTSSR